MIRGFPMRRSWCTDDLFDTSLPEREIVHSDAGAGSTISRLPRNESRPPFYWAPAQLPAQSSYFLDADLGECSITFDSYILGMATEAFFLKNMLTFNSIDISTSVALAPAVLRTEKSSRISKPVAEEVLARLARVRVSTRCPAKGRSI
jgi:hypothetical protein